MIINNHNFILYKYIIMIDIINIYENDNFYNNYVIKNRPCIIKNFYKTNDKCMKYYNKIKDNDSYFIKKSIGNVPAYYLSEKNICKNKHINNLYKNKDIYFYKNTRIWRHKKNNFTPWHYDGNGINVLNICITGSKRFYFSHPGSLPVYPLSNITMQPDMWDSNYIDAYPGDLVYIPSYWFHKVLTLEDNTFFINHNFLHKNNNLFATNRDLTLYTLHNIFNTEMCNNNEKVNICKLTKNKNKLYALIYGLYEFSWIYLILLLIYININKKQYFNYILLLLIIISLLHKQLNKNTSGIIKLYGVYLLIFKIYLIYFF